MGERAQALHFDVDNFIKRWAAREGGAERSNYALFLTELCDVIGVARPDPASAETEKNEYVFERAVRFHHDDGSTSPGRIDLYKRGCFVLEAKQSKKRMKGGEVFEQLALVLEGARGGTVVPERSRRKTGVARGSSPSSWDAFMRAARRQAEDYARALDEWPPFLIVVDVGHVIELYADFSGQGKNYAQFPDRHSFRIGMADLRRPEVRGRLKAVWESPTSLDPARKSAEVTQDIAAFLARMIQSIERRAPSKEPDLKAEWAYKTSKFLMGCIFAMFAERLELLPSNAFSKLVQLHKGRADRFHLAATDFFSKMDKGGYAPSIQADIRHFNGGLFREAVSVPVNEDELLLLEKAASRDWRNVEPAIFGTLLEQALSERERSQLGAHYTPRAFVERLVVPTVIEPLRADWEIVQSEAIGKLMDGDERAARETVKKFHDTLCRTRILDPACGTGNFLYVSMELMKRLEGEVLELLKELGEAQEPLATVDPHQFIGIEKNPRAVPIAELVLWIGYIQWWFRTKQRQVISEPILKDFKTIRAGDAVLTYDREEILRDETGRAITRQNPESLKIHPITGEPVPDLDARLPLYRYINPRPVAWPDAEFIVGNPPFIGKGEDMRTSLGDGYVKALWASRGKKSDSIDFVMYWWDNAASVLTRKDSKLRRFGFITTNSITQKFSRRVVEKHMSGPNRLSIVFAIPDHPWQKSPKSGRVRGAKKAAIRVAMTVAERGDHDGVLKIVTRETALDTDDPIIELRPQGGKINSDLTVGFDVSRLHRLRANEGIANNGMLLAGKGFVLNSQQAATLSGDLKTSPIIKKYVDGRDLTSRISGNYVVDLFDLTEEEVRRQHPRIYQHVVQAVLPHRETNNRKSYRERWWQFAEPRRTFRPALAGLSRYIATTETAKHRFFQFIDGQSIPDHMVVAIASADAFILGVLSARYHQVWALRVGGWLGVGNDPRYTKSLCFDTYPFPSASNSQVHEIRALAEELDALRKRVLSEHQFLTMTKLYNIREKLGANQILDPNEKVVNDVGCVSVIRKLHDELDAAVTDAYGWPKMLSEDEVLARLAALNGERVEGERRGEVHWLRREYQIGQLKMRELAQPEQIEASLDEQAAPASVLPKDDAHLVASLRAMLRKIGKPVEPKTLALLFRDGARATRRVQRGLTLLAAAGVVRRGASGWFLPSDSHL